MVVKLHAVGAGKFRPVSDMPRLRRCFVCLSSSSTHDLAPIPNAGDREYLTLVAPETVLLVNATALENPSLGAAPTALQPPIITQRQRCCDAPGQGCQGHASAGMGRPTGEVQAGDLWRTVVRAPESGKPVVG